MYEQEREGVVRACQHLAASGLVVGTAGNVSVRVSDEHVVVSASATPYEGMTVSNVSVVDLEGSQLEGDATPTSELQLHLAVYQARQCRAIVHTHSKSAVGVSTVQKRLPNIHYYLNRLGGRVDVAPYHTYGTRSLAEAVVDALGHSSLACLMANHGATLLGDNLHEAMEHAELLEWLCDVWLRSAAAGAPTLLSDDDLARAQERRGRNVYEERARSVPAPTRGSDDRDPHRAVSTDAVPLPGGE